jgi:hypothetical protein
MDCCADLVVVASWALIGAIVLFVLGAWIWDLIRWR